MTSTRPARWVFVWIAPSSLNEMVVGGVDTTIPLFQRLLAEPDILSGDYDIHWLEKWAKARAGG